MVIILNKVFVSRSLELAFPLMTVRLSRRESLTYMIFYNSKWTQNAYFLQKSFVFYKGSITIESLFKMSEDMKKSTK